MLPLHMVSNKLDIVNRVSGKLLTLHDILILKGMRPRSVYDFHTLASMLTTKEVIKNRVIGGYVLLYEVVESWFLEGRYLNELLIIRHGPGNFKELMDGMDELAKEEGCDGIISGTIAAPKDATYARLLERHGFKPVATQLIKEITWEQQQSL